MGRPPDQTYPFSNQLAAAYLYRVLGISKNYDMNVQDFIGEKATYDPDGQYIWGVGYDGEYQKLADLRGWGAIQNAFMSNGGMVDQEKAASFQDELGRWLADAINEKLANERTQ
jgi:hypothetical protein